MNFTIHRNLPRKKAMKLLGEGYAFQLPPGLKEPITILIFPDSVVKSRIVEKGLKKVEEIMEGSLVLAAREFTMEAKQMAEEKEAIILSTASESIQWTNESYEKIKIGVGARVKKPDLK